ncbi:MAG: hypothetical protein F6K09_02720 [Merismopedia sp. SIO2A8]|nr:hypothetical protein [Symploca sp. SIO2B6]NET47640.1 hypothetical protein [Merismopedia sp. SIO2A8]
MKAQQALEALIHTWRNAPIADVLDATIDAPIAGREGFSVQRANLPKLSFLNFGRGSSLLTYQPALLDYC